MVGEGPVYLNELQAWILKILATAKFAVKYRPSSNPTTNPNKGGVKSSKLAKGGMHQKRLGTTGIAHVCLRPCL